MPHFIIRIYTSFGYPEFFLNRILTASGVCYHVSVFDQQRKSHSFNMKEEKGSWVLVNPANCPIWILKVEKQVSGALQDYTAALKQ